MDFDWGCAEEERKMPLPSRIKGAVQKRGGSPRVLQAVNR